MAANQPTLSDIEQWLPVVGYEGYYDVSNHGRVRSLSRKVRRKDGALTTVHGRMLSPRKHPAGYRKALLAKDGHKTYVYIHRLVLEAFVGPCPEGMVACHWNDVPDDNRVENLRWDTPRENSFDKARNGNDHQRNKTHCPRGHILAEPNLDPSDRGRSCKACAYARKRVANRLGSEGRFEEMANSLYQEIMNGTFVLHGEQTECKRGHLFQGSNVTNYPSGRGRRGCLACYRARSRVNDHPELKPYLQQISDSYYEQIMSGAA